MREIRPARLCRARCAAGPCSTAMRPWRRFHRAGHFSSPWSPEALHDYVGDGFQPSRAPGRHRTDLRAPAWEASTSFQRHDTWGCFERSKCPDPHLRAETGSTCRVDGHEAELTTSGRIRIETIPAQHTSSPMERPELVRGPAGGGQRARPGVTRGEHPLAGPPAIGMTCVRRDRETA